MDEIFTRLKFNYKSLKKDLYLFYTVTFIGQVVFLPDISFGLMYFVVSDIISPEKVSV